VARMDRWMTGFARSLARRTSRRSVLAGIGTALVGGAAVPLLPVARGRAEPAPGDRVTPSGEPDPATPAGDPQDCGYWRYCAVDGFLSSCCGGSHNACPPGTQMSPITWLGTCRNPADGKEYVISYNDCCGKDVCGSCICRRHEGDKPVYYTPKSNDIDWCMGTREIIYNSTVAVVVGVAREKG